MSDATLIPSAPESPEAPAPATLPWSPGQSRPLSPEQLAQWRTRLERAAHKAKQFHPQWQRALDRYAKAKVEQAGKDVNALLDYRHVESKKSQLFHRTPEVSLTPLDPTDAETPYAQLLPLREKVLNFELGPKRANAKRALHKTLIDTLAASGWMIVEVGFEQVLLPVPPDELGQYPMDAQGQPVTSVPVWSRRFVEAISSMKLLIPHDFHDTTYDAAPFLAYTGTIPVPAAKKLGWTLPEGFTGSTKADEHLFQHGGAVEDANDAMCAFTKIWYRASLFDPTVFNPELYRCLILIDGSDVPAWHVDSPFQSLTPEGALTDDSLIGNPIHVGTLRDLPDSAYVPSDLVVGEQLSMELDKFRTDLTRNRTARRPKEFVADGLGADVLQKIAANAGPIPVPSAEIRDGKFQGFAVEQSGTEPRDNYTAQDIIERDYEQALGMSANQQGNFSKTKRTATEVRTVQGNSSARAQTEQDRIRDYFSDLVRKFDAILQRTASPQDISKILGKAGAELYDAWRGLPGTYAYDVLPDAGKYVDAKEHLTHTLDVYNLLRKDERVNPEYLLERVARALNGDPAKFIAPPRDKTTEPPSASVAFKGEDTTNEAMGNLLLDFCANAGIKLRPETIKAFAEQHALLKAMPGVAVPGVGMGANSDPNAHGGSANRTEPVNQHATDKTGGIQGVGVM